MRTYTWITKYTSALAMRTQNAWTLTHDYLSVIGWLRYYLLSYRSEHMLSTIHCLQEHCRHWQANFSNSWTKILKNGSQNFICLRTKILQNEELVYICNLLSIHFFVGWIVFEIIPFFQKIWIGNFFKKGLHKFLFEHIQLCLLRTKWRTKVYMQPALY